MLDTGDGGRTVRHGFGKPIDSLICDFVTIDALQLLEIN